MDERTSPIRRTRSVLALIVAATAVVTMFGTGTASAQAFAVDDPGTVVFDTTNRGCVTFTHNGSDPDNVTFHDAELIEIGGTAITPIPLSEQFHGLVLEEETFGFGPSAPTRWRLRGTGLPTYAGTTLTFRITATDDLGTVPTGDDETDTFEIDVRVVGESAAARVIGAGRLGLGYTIDCGNQAREVNGFVRSLANFGPTGTAVISGVNAANGVVVRDFTPFDPDRNTGAPIDADYLDGLDVLLDGWVFDSDWDDEELVAIEDWVHRGGVLVAAEDSGASDRLGELFGAETTTPPGPCAHTPSEPSDSLVVCPQMTAEDAMHPIVDGPFGDWSGSFLNTSGTVGQFDDTAGWNEVVSDPQGDPTVITREVGRGRVILLADEGLLRTEAYASGANATFVGNLIAYALGQVDFGASPAPVISADRIAVVEGGTISRDLCANDEDTGTVEVASWSTLPAGVTFDAGTCTLSGTVNEGFSVVYRVSIPGATASAVVTVSLRPDVDDTAITVAAGEEFSEDVCGEVVGETPATVAVTDGELPAGVELDDCTLSGSVDEAGEYPFEITVTDADDDTDTATVTLEVTAATARCRGLEATIVGQPGDETIEGTSGDDVIVGTDGDDVIRGLGGDDVICGLGGDDTIVGGSGADTVVGGGGDDTIVGGGGDDTVFAGGGADTVRGRGGDDVISGNRGDDRLLGGGGADRLLGGGGDDTVAGQAGAPDVCNGGSGTDTRGAGCETVRGLEEDETA